MTARDLVELFHLLFVRALFAGLADKKLLAIKGGINLRLFFQSIRYSEDLDLDVVTMSKRTLENRVDRLLESPAIVSVLRARGVVIEDISKPKQTETVQKWKLAVRSLSTELVARTKVEFSRRPGFDSAQLDAIDAQIAGAYGIPPFPATHYRCADAVRQKLDALQGRSVTQPRDVFDLNVLFARPDAPTELDHDARTWVEPAVAKVMSLTYEEYVSLVVAYLDPEQSELYASPEAWETMQLAVVSKLEALK